MPFATSLKGVASLRLTVISLVLLGAGGIVVVYGRWQPTQVLLVPLALLGINLLAVIVTAKALRRSAALHIFHVALLVILILAGFSRLTYFKGQVELTTGESFTGQLLAAEQGPWHSGALQQVRFVNAGVQVVFGAGGVRGPTRNAVQWFDAQGHAYSATIGDNTPLLLHGYRIYPSKHFGYALLFSWTPVQTTTPSQGSVHLPSLRLGAGMSNSWTIPGSEIPALALLQLSHPVPDPVQPSLLTEGGEHTVLVTIGGETRTLQPGTSWSLPEGVLIYESLQTWMGYTLFYDPAMPWLLAAALVAVVAMAWHWWRKFASKPWHSVAA